MEFKDFLQFLNEAESTAEKDDKAEKAGKKVAKDIEYDEGHKGKDDDKAEKAGKKVTKDIEYDDKKDKKSLKDWFEMIDKNMLAEAEQVSIEPAKQNTQVLKKGDQVIGTVTNPALAANIKSAIGKGEMSLDGHEMKEEALDEKWAGDAEVKQTGQYSGKSVEELKSMLAKLKKSGPHKEGSPGFKKMRQIMFAIRAKKGWKGGVDEAQDVNEKAKNPYAIGMAQAMKSTGDEPPLKKSTITKAHDIAKKIKKTDEAEIPKSGPDYGAGLGAGRNAKVLESKQVNEAMNTLEAAYHEGKSHGLSKHGYACRYNEGSEEHRRYHEGFKEGLDECYGLMPNRGLVVSEVESGADVVDDMASFGAEEGDLAETSFEPKDQHFYKDMYDSDDEAEKMEGNAFTAALAKTDKGDKFKVGGKTFTDRSNYDAEVDEDFASGAKKLMKGIGTVGRGVGTVLGKTARAAVTVPAAIAGGVAGLASAAKQGYQAGKTATGTANEGLDEYAFESLDKQLNDLLNEGVSVNMSQGLGGPGAEDSVSVTAQGDDAGKLLQFIKQVGLGGLGAPEQVDGPSEPAVAVSDYGAPKFDGYDKEKGDMMGLLKVMSGDDYKDEEGHDHDDMPKVKMCGTHGVDEAKCGCGEGKEMVDEVESEDQMEYQVAEDDGEGNIEADEQGAQIDAALAVGSENEKAVHEAGDGGEESSPEAAGAVAAADADEEQEEAMSESSFLNLYKKLSWLAEESTAEKDDKAEKAAKKVAKDIEYDEGHKGKDDEKAEKAGEKVKKDIEYDDKKDKKEKVDEWANDAGKDGTQQTFERDIEFMTKVISGGLNKPKSTGQQTIPVLAGDKERTGDEDMAEYKKLAGLGQ